MLSTWERKYVGVRKIYRENCEIKLYIYRKNDP